MKQEILKTKKPFITKYREEIKCYALLIIPIALFSLFFVYGFIRGFYISLSNYDLRYVATRGVQFIGFKNYINAFKDINFINGLKHTAIWMVVMLVGNNLFGLLTAACICKLTKGKGFFLVGMYWPALVSAAVGTQITLYMFNPTESGVLNTILAAFGKSPVGWLYEQKTALLSLMIIPFFTGFSMKMMVYYAGLKSIPKTYYEAASLETTNGFQVFTRITLPLLAPIIFLNVLLSIIDGVKVISPMQLITPKNEYTVSAVYALYQEAFDNTNFAYSFAMGFILFVIILALTIFQNKLQKEEVVYD